MTAPAFIYTSEPWAALSIGRPIFRPSIHEGYEGCELTETCVRSPTVQSALRCSSDTLLASTLRAVELVIADQSQTNSEMIKRLWDMLLNNPHLIQAAGPENSPFGPTWLSVRPAPATVGHGF
jgi:hypothetical protein